MAYALQTPKLEPMTVLSYGLKVGHLSVVRYAVEILNSPLHFSDRLHALDCAK